MIVPSRTTTAPMGTSLRFTPSRARSSALRMYCSSTAGDPSLTPSADSSMRLSPCKRRLFRRPEGELALRVLIDHDVVAFVEFSLEDGEREGVLQQSLNRSLEWACSERRIVTFRRQHIARGGCQLEG